MFRLAFLILLALPVGAWAQPVTDGSEFDIRQTNVGRGVQEFGKAVVDTGDGGFVVTWLDREIDGDGDGVAARVFDDMSVPVTGDFVVNSYTTDGIVEPSIARAGDAFVVAWESRGYDGTINGRVLARRFDTAGAAVGTEWLVSAATSGDFQERPDVAQVGDGFVIVWQEFDPEQILGALYDGSGDPIGTEFVVNTYTTGSGLRRPSVAGRANGFVVVWRGKRGQANHPSPNSPIVGRRFNLQAIPIGTEFAVTTYTSHSGQTPNVATRPDGSFIVAWRAFDQATAGNDVMARRFGRDATPIGDVFAVTSYTTEAQEAPTVAALNDGRYVVAWADTYREGGVSSYRGVYARMYDRDHSALGTEFHVNTYTTSDQGAPSVVGLGSGAFVVTWNDYQYPDLRIKGQKYTVPASPGTTLYVPSTTTTTTSTTTTTTTTTTTIPVTTTTTVPVTTTLPATTTTTVMHVTTTTMGAAGICGDPVDPASVTGRSRPATVTASDALFVLQAATGLRACADCVCDVNSSGGITATDALAVLRAAVGQPVELACPACGP